MCFIAQTRVNHRLLQHITEKILTSPLKPMTTHSILTDYHKVWVMSLSIYSSRIHKVKKWLLFDKGCWLGDGRVQMPWLYLYFDWGLASIKLYDYQLHSAYSEGPGSNLRRYGIWYITEMIYPYMWFTVKIASCENPKCSPLLDKYTRQRTMEYLSGNILTGVSFRTYYNVVRFSSH